MKQKRYFHINLLLFIILIVSTYFIHLINFLDLKTWQEIINTYSNALIPYSFTFNITLVIHSFLFISIIYLIVVADSLRDDKNYLEILSPTLWFILIFNIFSILSFSKNIIILSFIASFIQTLLLIKQNKKITSCNDYINFIVPLTFGLYLGWTFIVTLTNLFIFLNKINWNGFYDIPFGFWINVIMCLIMLWVILLQPIIKNAIFPTTVAWGFWGLLKNNNHIFELLAIFIIILIIISIITLLKNRFHIIPEKK